MSITTQNLVIPTSAEMIEISQDLLPKLEADRPIFGILPVRTADASMLIWEQESNFNGLQGWRGLNGSPGQVAQTGANQYAVRPGSYGEYMLVDELMITDRRQYGNPIAPIDIVDLVTDNLAKLLQRRLDRIETIGWNILQGSYSVTGANGAVQITDSFSVQTYGAVADGSNTVWSATTTSKPFSDFSNVKLLHRGHSVSFGAGATAYMNQTTYNALITCSNQADIAGRRIPGLADTTIGNINSILSGADLPSIVVYDEGYLDDSGAFQLYIPNNKVIVVGKRAAGQKIGEYRMTRNANNPASAPGAYVRVEVKPEIPIQVQVHDGHNGGPVLYFPSSIVVMTV